MVGAFIVQKSKKMYNLGIVHILCRLQHMEKVLCENKLT